MLQAEENGGRKVITAAYEMDDLYRNDFEGYVATMNRRLRNLDSQLAAKEALEREPSFREIVASQAPIDLVALGVSHAKTAWRLGVIATRVWLLEIASPPVVGLSPALRTWRGAAIAPADSPFGQWQLWRHVAMLADGVREMRCRRSFGPSQTSSGDIEEARVSAGIANDAWLEIRERAAWVMR